MRRRLVATTVALLTLAGAQGAFAAPRGSLELIDSWKAPPMVLPSGTVAIRDGLARNRPRVAFTSPAGRLRVLHQFDRLISVVGRLGGDESYQEFVAFRVAASATWVAVTAFRTANFYDGASETGGIALTDLEVARRSGPARRLARCRFHEVVPVLTGSVIAYNDCGSAAVIARDLDDPEDPVRRFETDAGTRPTILAVADRYVLARLDPPPRKTYESFRPPGPTVLLDRATGQEVARTGSIIVQRAALRSDGTAVLVAAASANGTGMPDGCSDADLALYILRPGTPDVPLGLPACDGMPSIDGDRVLFAFPSAPGSRTWGLTTIAGGEPRDLGYVLEPTLTGEDGLVRLRESTCLPDTVRFRFVRLPTLERDGMPRFDRCTLRLRSRTARVDRRGVARVRYACPAGCQATVRVKGTEGARVSSRPTTRGLLRVQLLRKLRGRLRREGRLTVDAEINVSPLGTPPVAPTTERVTLVG